MRPSKFSQSSRSSPVISVGRLTEPPEGDCGQSPLPVHNFSTKMAQMIQMAPDAMAMAPP
jgi:hypothetical protein